MDIKKHCNLVLLAKRDWYNRTCNRVNTKAKYVKGSYINKVLNDGNDPKFFDQLDAETEYQVCSEILKKLENMESMSRFESKKRALAAENDLKKSPAPEKTKEGHNSVVNDGEILNALNQLDAETKERSPPSENELK